MISYADESNNARKSKLTVDKKVLVLQPKGNKLTTPFDPKPHHITEKTGTMVTAKRDNKSITRKRRSLNRLEDQSRYH